MSLRQRLIVWARIKDAFLLHACMSWTLSYACMWAGACQTFHVARAVFLQLSSLVITACRALWQDTVSGPYLSTL